MSDPLFVNWCIKSVADLFYLYLFFNTHMLSKWPLCACHGNFLVHWNRSYGFHKGRGKKIKTTNGNRWKDDWNNVHFWLRKGSGCEICFAGLKQQPYNSSIQIRSRCSPQSLKLAPVFYKIMAHLTATSSLSFCLPHVTFHPLAYQETNSVLNIYFFFKCFHPILWKC